MSSRPMLWCLSAAALLNGCAPVGGERFSEARGALEEPNGISLNGISLNGRSLNGLSLNGRSLNGLSLNGVQIGGVALSSTWLKGTVFHGTDSQGHKLSKRDFVDAVFTGLLDDQSTILLIIDGMSSSHGNPDVKLYDVSFAADDGAHPLCTDRDGAPTQAIPLVGRWNNEQGVPWGGAWIDDASVFTFACLGYALAKCVEFGYEPWSTVKVKVDKHKKVTISLAGHHQACTRLLRADYCGDGTPHTVNGTMLNLYDGLGIQADVENWPFEAEWTPDGARCVTHRRVPTLPAPDCLPSLLQSDCGSPAHFATGTLLMSEDSPTE